MRVAWIEKPSLLQIFQSTDYLTYFKMHLEYAVNMHVRPKKMPYSALVIGTQTPKRSRPALDVADLADDGALADDEATPKKPPKAKKKPKAKAPQAPPKAPKPEPKPVPHVGGAGGALKGDGIARTPEGGSAFPDNKFMARNDIDDSLLVIIQAKLDQSNGIDKGACAWCLFGPNGCPKDKRVGLQGRAAARTWARRTASRRSASAACKTAGLEGPLYLNNKKFWTTSLSGHSAAEAKPKAKPAGAAKGTPVPSEAEDDDDDEP